MCHHPASSIIVRNSKICSDLMMRIKVSKANLLEEKSPNKAR